VISVGLLCEYGVRVVWLLRDYYASIEVSSW